LYALDRVKELKAAGMSEARAARRLCVSVQSLWRWRNRRLVPNYHLSGRRTAFLQNLKVPAAVIRRVRALRLQGIGNQIAWRTVAAENICPPGLADYLRSTRNISQRLLKATKEAKREVVILEVRATRKIRQ